MGSYLGFQPADPKKDFEFSLGTFVVQHLSFGEIVNTLSTLVSDLHNCSAVLEKFLLISNQDKSLMDGKHLLLSTELEYLVIVIRSIYDLLQKLSKYAAALIRNPEKPQIRGISLPDSFAKIVLDGERVRSTDEIRNKFNLPESLAKFYASKAIHFKWLREFRVAIEHHGHNPPIIFDLDDGVAVSLRDYPWNTLSVWQDNQDFIRNNHLGSLHAVFVYLISEVIETTSQYSNAFSEAILLPPAVEPGIKFYVRNYFSHHLVDLNHTMQSPWERLKL